MHESLRSPPSLFFPKSIYLAEEPYRPFHPSILPRNYSRDLLLLLFPSAVFVNEMVIASSSSELQSSILALCCIVIQTDNMYVLTKSKTNVDSEVSSAISKTRNYISNIQTLKAAKLPIALTTSLFNTSVIYYGTLLETVTKDLVWPSNRDFYKSPGSLRSRGQWCAIR